MDKIFKFEEFESAKELAHFINYHRIMKENIVSINNYESSTSYYSCVLFYFQ